MQKDKSYLPLTKEQVASNIFGNIPSRSVSLYQPINKNIQKTIPAMQNIDTNLSNVENPLFPGKMLSTGALEEINRLNKPTSISPQVTQPEIQNEEEQNNNRFLASLLGQGVAMFGAGIAGRDPMRTAESIEDMRYYQRRSDERQKQIDQAKKLMDPNSQESQRKRNLYKKVLSLPIPEDISASDLEDPIVLNSLKQQSIQAQMAKMPKQVGAKQPKEEKEIKSNQKSMAEYREHVSSLAEMGNVLNKIKLLNRTGIGTITPDFSVDTQAYATSLDRAAQPMIKTLAGPGTLQKEERDTYGKLVPTGNTRADLALRQANDIIVEGTDKALSKMNADLSTGDISKKDYDALINQYNEQLSKKGIGINQIINPNTGRLETRQKREVTLKDGKKAIVDQFGYVWE